MSIQRIQDTRKIVASGSINNFAPDAYSISSVLPYFDKVGTWEGIAGGAENKPVVLEENVKLYNVSDNLRLAAFSLAPPGGPVGFIIDIEMPVGSSLRLQMNNALEMALIYETGRYTGILTSNNTAAQFNAILLSNPSGLPITIKSLFYFNATCYTYEDFLQSPISYLSVEQKNTPDSIDATSPRLGWADAIPTTGSWRVGDRLESTVWDGKFSSTIAWVCTAVGTPGTWKAVTLFDSYNSSKDPYFQSFIGAAGLWQTLDIAPSVSTMAPGQLVLNCGATGYALVQQANVNCCTGGELITVEATVTGQTNAAAAQLRPANDTIAAVTFGAPGSSSVDRSIVIGASSPGTFWIRNSIASSIHTFSKLIVRPKYPFLTKAPASFAALPSVLPTSPLPNTWYLTAAGPTYAAEAITLGVNRGVTELTGYIIQAGRTLRCRYNITQLLAGAMPYVYVHNADGTTNLFAGPTALGINELTFTMLKPVSRISFMNHSSATDTFSFNYVRFYTE